MVRLPWESLAVPQKVKQTVTTWLSDSTPRYAPKENENTHPRRNT